MSSYVHCIFRADKSMRHFANGVKRLYRMQGNSLVGFLAMEE